MRQRSDDEPGGLATTTTFWSFFLDLLSCFNLVFFWVFCSLHEILSVLQSREKYFGTNFTLTLCMCPYVQESKKLQAIIFNKDKHKWLARKNGNEYPIWSWNDSMVRYMVLYIWTLYFFIVIWYPTLESCLFSLYSQIYSLLNIVCLFLYITLQFGIISICNIISWKNTICSGTFNCFMVFKSIYKCCFSHVCNHIVSLTSS